MHLQKTHLSSLIVRHMNASDQPVGIEYLQSHSYCGFVACLLFLFLITVHSHDSLFWGIFVVRHFHTSSDYKLSSSSPLPA